MMKEFENNGYFWQKVDTLLMSCTLNIINHKGEHHKKYPDFIYPLDFGYLVSDLNDDSKGIACYIGHEHQFCNSAIVSVDILDGECFVQFLIGCNEQQEEQVLKFLNQSEFQKTVIIRRAKEIPSWAVLD